jgi:hypothetical protein
VPHFLTQSVPPSVVVGTNLTEPVSRGVCRRSSRRVRAPQSLLHRPVHGRWSNSKLVATGKSTGGVICRFLSLCTTVKGNCRAPAQNDGRAGPTANVTGFSGTPASTGSRYKDLDEILAVRENSGLLAEGVQAGGRPGERETPHVAMPAYWRRSGTTSTCYLHCCYAMDDYYSARRYGTNYIYSIITHPCI